MFFTLKQIYKKQFSINRGLILVFNDYFSIIRNEIENLSLN